MVIILFGNCCSLFINATPQQVWAISRIGYLNILNEPTGSGSRKIPDK